MGVGHDRQSLSWENSAVLLDIDISECDGEQEDFQLFWFRAEGQEHGQDIIDTLVVVNTGVLP